MFNDDEIVQSVTSNHSHELSERESDYESVEVVPKIQHKEAVSVFGWMIDYLEEQSDTDRKDILTLMSHLTVVPMRKSFSRKLRNTDPRDNKTVVSFLNKFWWSGERSLEIKIALPWFFHSHREYNLKDKTNKQTNKPRFQGNRYIMNQSASNSSVSPHYPEDSIWVKVTILVACSGVFFYVNTVMVIIFLKEPVYRDSPRYLLFIHLLLNDTIQLVLSIILFFYFTFQKSMLISVCSVFVHFTGSTSMNSPINLAVMALERYAAICFPLHYEQISTMRKGYCAIVIIWFIGALPTISDLFIVLVTEPLDYFEEEILFCSREALISFPYQNVKRIVFNALYFTTVWLILFYTYIMIILQARKAATDKVSATKAQKTLMLHGGQLILCMSFFFYPVSEYILKQIGSQALDHVRFVNYILSIVFPKFLSPLIYGVRDEKFKKHLKQYLLCRSNNVHSISTVA
nr:PREDICTED: olfactory receptor 4K14-like [Latimeria chalumnae]|eukprot:XP_014348050.1 PREDICTED: olfactory receptor 4K14-like [Latimeria chalumnae]